jgi:hypothetical protein
MRATRSMEPGMGTYRRPMGLPQGRCGVTRKGTKSRTSAPRRKVVVRASMIFMILILAAGAYAAEGPPPAAGPSERDLDRNTPRRGGAREPSPLREFTDPQGRTCRVYAQRIVIEGGEQTALATVCREANGRWVLSR